MILKIYEIQNIGKGVITAILPENLLLLTPDPIVPGIQDVLSVQQPIDIPNHFITVLPTGQFVVFGAGGNGSLLSLGCDTGLSATFPTSSIGTCDGFGFAIQSLDFYKDKIILKDTVNSKGIEYLGDYETNFTARSLVTKQYVDSVGIQDTITNNPFIDEGGMALNENSYISVVSGNSVWKSGQFLVATLTTPSPTSILAIIGLGQDLLGKDLNLSFFPTKAIFTDTLNNKGLEYAGDYEANFSARSLVTKQYVDGINKIINRGWFSGMNVGTISPLTTGINIITAVTTSTPGGTNSIVLVTVANAMPSMNYFVEVVGMESISGTVDTDNDITTPTFRKISTTQFELGFRELAALTQNLKVHIQVITY